MQISGHKRLFLILFLTCALLLNQFVLGISFINPSYYLELDIVPSSTYNSASGEKLLNWLNSLESSGAYTFFKISERELKQNLCYKNSKTYIGHPLILPSLLADCFYYYNRISCIEPVKTNFEILLQFLHNQDGMK